MKRIGFILSLFAITALCYSRLFTAEFTLLDDTYTVQTNPRLNPPSIASAWSYWPPVNADHQVNAVYGLYMPLTYTFWSGLAFMAETPDPATAGKTELNPYVFHVANIFLHAASGTILFLILTELLKSNWAAWIGALLFLLHPVQVEAVAWISGAKDLLAGLFSLFAIWQHIRAYTATSPGNRRLHDALALLAFLSALFSKPSAIMIPLIILTIDVLALNQRWRSSLMALTPWIIVSIAFAMLGALAQPAGEIDGGPLWARPLIAGDALAFYIFKLIVPINLAIDYGHRPPVVMQHRWFYVTWLLPAIVAVAVWWRGRTWPTILAGALIFLIAMVPTLGLVKFLFQRHSTTADHYLYLPMFGIALRAAAKLARFDSRKVRILALAIIALLASLTIIQTGYWHDDQRLFSHALEVNPSSSIGITNLAVANRREHPLLTPP